MRFLFILISIIYSFTLIAQTNIECKKINSDSVYNNVEQMPQFPGGEVKMLSFVLNNLKIPIYANDALPPTRALAKIIIPKEGKMRDI